MNLKVDCDTFDQELVKITALLNALNKGEKVEIPTQSGNTISSKDMQMIMEAIGRIDGLEAMLKKLLADMAALNLDEIKKAIADLKENKADKKDLELLQSEMRQKLKALEDAIAKLRQDMI